MTTLAAGRALTRRAFATITLPYARNARDGESEGVKTTAGANRED